MYAVCMHRETFDISHALFEEVKNNIQDYFEIDDLIAFPVQVLNRKGYITRSCCSGHQFGHKDYKDYLVISDAHIWFKKGVYLPSFPPGFVKDDLNSGPDSLAIKNNYPRPWESGDEKFLSDYKFWRNIIESMEQLYEWALNLPDFKSE